VCGQLLIRNIFIWSCYLILKKVGEKKEKKKRKQQQKKGLCVCFLFVFGAL
jgi:hypothetical protein